MAVSVEPFDDLAAVALDAAGALDRAAQPCLFDRIDWFRLVERHAAPPGRLLVLRAADGDERAWLFLKVENGRARALANWYSLGFGIVGNESLTRALAAALRRHRIHSLELCPLLSPRGLANALGMEGWVTHDSRAGVNRRMDTSGMDFAAYWSRRPSRLRHTAERRAKAAALDIHILTRFDCAAWADYEAVYQASWKPAEGAPQFLRELAEMESAAGTLRLGIARKDGRPIAGQLWLVENKVATIHKLAHAEEAHSLSPGTVLSMEIFRRVLDEDRVEAIDFGLGDEPYKADWIDQARPVHRLIAYDLRSLRGLAAVSRAAASKLVRLPRSG